MAKDEPEEPEELGESFPEVQVEKAIRDPVLREAMDVFRSMQGELSFGPCTAILRYSEPENRPRGVRFVDLPCEGERGHVHPHLFNREWRWRPRPKRRSKA